MATSFTNPRISVAAANAGIIAAVSSLLNGGALAIYDGAQPVTVVTAITDQNLYASFTLGNPAFGAPVNGAVSATAIASVTAVFGGATAPAYNPSANYSTNTLVSYGGQTYICIVSYTGPGSSSPSPTYWDLYTGGQNVFWFRLSTSGGTPVLDGTVGVTGCDLNLNSAWITAGDTVAINSLVITLPQEGTGLG